jgi:transposase
VGRRAGHGAQRGDHVSRPRPPRLAAHKKSLHASERDEATRAAWRTDLATLDPSRLVFVDECGTHIALTRLRARAPRGERAIGRVPRNHGPNLTLFAALTPQGMGPALVVEGGADHTACAAYVRKMLVPSLRPGQVVVMDRLNVHQGAAIREAIAAAGCELRLLPAYSPDFNPIEPVFAKLKTHLRAAAARTAPALIRTIGMALERITPADACHCYTHCGYPLSARLL